MTLDLRKVIQERLDLINKRLLEIEEEKKVLDQERTILYSKGQGMLELFEQLRLEAENVPVSTEEKKEEKADGSEGETK